MAISATASKKETQFLWEGKDKRGHKVRGKALAANEATLRADLRRQGVAATRVKTQGTLFRSGGKVSNEDIAVFSRQLATMMSAGIPMVQAFEIIGNGHEKPAMQKLVLDIKSNIEGGSTTLCSSIWSRRVNRQARSRRFSTRSPLTKKRPKL
jgi:type IV pilus assembly protein PilC